MNFDLTLCFSDGCSSSSFNFELIPTVQRRKFGRLSIVLLQLMSVLIDPPGLLTNTFKTVKHTWSNCFIINEVCLVNGIATLQAKT